MTLLIIGLIGGAVALTVPDGRPRLSDEAERLTARLARAREEAVLTNRAVDVSVTSDGYGFRVLRAGAWTPLRDGPFRDQAWPEGVAAVLEAADGRTSVRFDATGMAAPARIVLRREAERLAVVVDWAGEVRIHDPAG